MFAKTYTSIVFTKKGIRVFDAVKKSGKIFLENQVFFENQGDGIDSCLKLLGDYKTKSNKVYFSLPDTFSKTIIEENDLSQGSNLEEFVRWKTAKKLLLRTEDYAFDFHRLTQDKSLSVFLKKDVVEKIQDYAEKAKNRIQKINIHTFNILGALEINSERKENQACALILIFNDYVIVLCFKENHLDFYRCKIKRGAPENSLADINHSLKYFLTRHAGMVLANIYIIDPERYLEQQVRDRFAKVTVIQNASILGFSSSFKQDSSYFLYYLSAAGAIL